MVADRALAAIVLAAGEGTRMRSDRPKPLHLLCGKAMVVYVLDALAGLGVDPGVVVVGHGADDVRRRVSADVRHLPLVFVDQVVQRGTGDAVSVGLTGLTGDTLDGDVIVLPGDTPMLRAETMASLVDEHRLSGAACTMLTSVVADPTGYGRVVRDKDDRVRRIVEHGDATSDERRILEICTSIYCFRAGLLVPALRRLDPSNAQGEYYLTDVVHVLAESGHTVTSLVADDPIEPEGVNDRVQLARAEAELRRRTNDAWLRAGVTMLDPERTYVDATVELRRDVTLFPGVHLRGATTVGAGSEIGVGAIVTDATIGSGARVGAYAVLGPGADVADGAVTAPFYTQP